MTDCFGQKVDMPGDKGLFGSTETCQQILYDKFWSIQNNGGNRKARAGGQQWDHPRASDHMGLEAERLKAMKTLASRPKDVPSAKYPKQQEAEDPMANSQAKKPTKGGDGQVPLKTMCQMLGISIPTELPHGIKKLLINTPELADERVFFCLS